MGGCLPHSSSGSFRDYKSRESAPVKAWLVGEIPFETIEEVNWSGDEYYPYPHIFCHFDNGTEPYERLVLCDKREVGEGLEYFKELAAYAAVEKASARGTYFY